MFKRVILSVGVCVTALLSGCVVAPAYPVHYGYVHVPPEPVVVVHRQPVFVREPVPPVVVVRRPEFVAAGPTPRLVVRHPAQRYESRERSHGSRH